jgi:DNA-binding response OmpR family regulator
MPRILVVDDDESIREFLKACIEEKGYQVEAVRDSLLALARFPAFRPHLVLLDIILPEMSGITVLARMKAMNPDVCVIMITGVAHEGILRKAMDQGADDYLVKPFDLAQLEVKLSIHLLIQPEDE